jgi:hypothetical protein
MIGHRHTPLAASNRVASHSAARAVRAAADGCVALLTDERASISSLATSANCSAKSIGAHACGSAPSFRKRTDAPSYVDNDAGILQPLSQLRVEFCGHTA